MKSFSFYLSILIDILYMIFLYNFDSIKYIIGMNSFQALVIPTMFYSFYKEFSFKTGSIIFRRYLFLSNIIYCFIFPFLLFNNLKFSYIMLFSLPTAIMLFYYFFEFIKGEAVYFILNTLSLIEARNTNKFNSYDFMYSITIIIYIFAWLLYGYLPSECYI